MKKRIILLLLVLAMTCQLFTAAFAEEKVELTFWHQYVDFDVMDQIAADFNALHPNITVKPVALATVDMNKTLRMALTSGTGPDLFQYDSGPGYLGALARAGLLMELTEPAKQYGWTEELAGWSVTAGTMDGKLYGLANEYEILCAFYNKAIFEKLGVTVPTTYDEFVNICKVAKDNGVVGLVLDDMEKWPGYHYESLFYGAFGGNELVKGVIDQTVEGGWNQPVLAEALDALSALVKEGYTSSFPNGIAHDDALRDFYTGGGAMYLTGTWAAQLMYDNMGDNVGIFVFPAAKEGVATMPPVGVGSAMQVNANTKYPEETLMFLDYLYDAKGGAKTLMYATGTITPCDVDTADATFNPLFLEVTKIANNTDVYNHNIDVLMPANVNDATGNYIQQILDGYITGADAVALKQDAFEQAIAEG
ncbi:MAG: extracellular solute-binding protein [Clostridia bacterium]